MDQHKVPRAKTFALKTNIRCKGCEKKLNNLLKEVGAVDKISIDAAEGKVNQIIGTIDPHKVLKLSHKNGQKSELLWEPVMDHMESHVVPTPQSSRHGTRYYHTDHHDNKHLVVRLEKMSEIKGLRCVEVEMKLTFREYDEDNGKNDTCLARKSDRTAMHHGDPHAKGTYNPSDDHCPTSHGSCCLRNKAMYTHAHGSQGNAPLEGNPRPGYIKASAPPLIQMPQFDSPAPPSYESIAFYSHPVFSAFSDENPSGCLRLRLFFKKHFPRFPTFN